MPANDSVNDSVKEQLQFDRTEDEQRFQCIYDQFSTVAQDAGISEKPMQHFENDGLVSKQWCSGKGSKDSTACQNPFFAGPLRNAGSQFMLVQTFVADAFPKVIGTLESFGQNPVDESAWGIQFDRAVDSQFNNGNDSLSILFTRFNADKGEFQTELIFANYIAHPFVANRTSVDLPGNIMDDFEQLSASPELFTSTFEARYDALQAEVERQFATGELADDTGNELTEALAYIQTQRETIRDNAPELHALITNFVDTSRCK